MHPLVPGRCLLHERCKLGLDEVRQSGFYRALDACDVQLRLLLFPDRPALHVLFDRLVRLPDAVWIGGDFLERSTARNAVGLVLDDRALGLRSCILVALLDQEPRFVLVILPAATSHEHPAAVQLLAIEIELHASFAVVLDRIASRNPDAAIPQQHRPRPILPGRYGALEGAVLDGMVFDVHCKPPYTGVEARPLGHSPAQ